MYPETKAINPEELLPRQRRVRRGVGHVSALKVLMSNSPASQRQQEAPSGLQLEGPGVKQGVGAPASFPTSHTLLSAVVPLDV